MDNQTDHHQLDPGEYFAAQDPIKTQSILLEKARSFFRVLEANFYLEKVHNMWRFYHGAYNAGDNSGHTVSFVGEQGELTSLPVNHFRNIASHIYTMITANRPVMDARAINTDYKSMAQTYLANGILDYYMREKRLEDCIKKAAEMAIVMGTGYVKMEWNATAGEAFDADPETGQVDYQGEVEFSNLSPMDVVVDGTKENWNNEWMLCRTFQNRFNLMAKYPDLAEKIAGLPSKAENTIYRLALFSNDETDDIPVYEFYHKRTEAMPDGRYLLFVGDDITLLDIPIPYRVIPIFRIVPSEYIGTPYGYTPMMDIFPIQEMINSTVSTIATNQNAFGVQNIFVKRGADISINTLEGAMNLIEGNEKPEIIKMLNTEPEIFKFLELLIQSAETLSGVNSVARGNPEASLKSGTALALVQSMALQFVSGLQQNYVKLIEDVGTALIQILKDYASYPKVVAIVGKNNRPLLKEFTGEDLQAINRVIVDMGNPLSRTIAGRVQMAEQMLQMKLLQTPEQYFQVLNTGRLDATYEGEMSELLLIKSENEKILEGDAPLVSPFDRHKMHIMEHKAVLADPDLRSDPKLVKVALDHIQGHVDALRNTDPSILQLLGEQPLMPPQGMMPPGQPPPPGADGRMPPATPLNNAPAPSMLSPVAGQIQPGQQIVGPGVQNVNVPQPAHPPKPFQNLPTNPNQMGPPPIH